MLLSWSLTVLGSNVRFTTFPPEKKVEKKEVEIAARVTQKQVNKLYIYTEGHPV